MTISFDAYLDEMVKIAGTRLQVMRGALSRMRPSDPGYRALQARIDAKSGSRGAGKLFARQERAASRSRFGFPDRSSVHDPWAPRRPRRALAGPARKLPG